VAPFEVLYGCQCCTLLNWIEPGEKVTFHCDHIDKAEATVNRIQDNLKAVKSCQESYANKTEGPENTIRGGGVNGSQSKFST
jgi:hypothetical protein